MYFYVFYIYVYLYTHVAAAAPPPLLGYRGAGGSPSSQARCLGRSCTNGQVLFCSNHDTERLGTTTDSKSRFQISLHRVRACPCLTLQATVAPRAPGALLQASKRAKGRVGGVRALLSLTLFILWHPTPIPRASGSGCQLHPSPGVSGGGARAERALCRRTRCLQQRGERGEPPETRRDTALWSGTYFHRCPHGRSEQCWHIPIPQILTRSRNAASRPELCSRGTGLSAPKRPAPARGTRRPADGHRTPRAVLPPRCSDGL